MVVMPSDLKSTWYIAVSDNLREDSVVVINILRRM